MKRFLTGALLALLLVSTVLPALAEEARVFDRADLFTAAQEEQLEEAIADFQQETGMDFVLLTSAERHDGSSQQQVADAFYDHGGFGFDEENSGILYYIDMDERIPYLSTTGKMIDYMTDERIEAAHENCWQAMHDGRYQQAALTMISNVQRYVERGIPEGQYRYDVVTGRQLTQRHKALTQGELLVCIVLAAVTWLVFTSSIKGSYKLKGSTYRYHFRDHCDIKLTGVTDDYLRTTTVRTRKSPPPSSGGSSGFGGRSGGSGVHSSGGVSHGGGAGRRF